MTNFIVNCNEPIEAVSRLDGKIYAARLLDFRLACGNYPWVILVEGGPSHDFEEVAYADFWRGRGFFVKSGEDLDIRNKRK